MPEYTAVCPKCDNIIELEGNIETGDHVECDNVGCFWEGTIAEIDKDGNVWFEEEEAEED